jgi:hypothetical protein
VKLIVNLLQSTPSFDFILMQNDDLCLDHFNTYNNLAIF